MNQPQTAARDIPWAWALVVSPVLAASAIWAATLTVDAPALIAALSLLAVAAPFIATLMISRRRGHPVSAALSLAVASAAVTIVLMALIGAALVHSLGEIGPPDD